MLNKRTKNSKTFINFDGSYTTEIHMGDVHFDDESGNFHNINTDLFDEADLDTWDLPINKYGKEKFHEAKNKAKEAKAKNALNRDLFDYQGLHVPFEVKLPRNFRKGYTVGKGQDKLTFKPIGASSSKAYVEEGKKNFIHYQDAWNDSDVTLELTTNGVKETIILKTDRAPVSFSFEVVGAIADDLTAGELKLQPAWLQDAEGTKRDVGQTVRREGDKAYIDLVADVTGLVYPIEIDPTVVIQPDATAGKDTWVNSDGPTTNYGTDFTIRASSLNGGATLYNGLIQFDLSSIPSGGSLSDAQMSLYMVGGMDRSLQLTVYPISSAWNEATVTWNTQPSNLTTPSSVKDIPYSTTASWQTWAITDIVSQHVNGTIVNNGYVIKRTNTNNGDGQFWSSDYTTDVTLRPKLSVTYNAPPTAPVVTAPNGGETWNSLHTVSLNASTDDSTAQSSLQYQIQLTTDNSVNWKDIVALTSEGATSYAYDFINEPETSTAKVRARAFDGTSYGAWDESDGVFTIVHNQAPTAPTNLSPVGGVKDRALVNRLSWQHNDANLDPQAQFDLLWRLQGASTWNTVSQVTVNQYWDALANTFPKGTIEWQVRTYDQAGLSSPYSALTTFNAGDKPSNATITSPANGSTVSFANPTVQWSSVGQVDYHLKVLSAASALLWESIKTSTNKAETVQYALQNSTSYKIELAIKNVDGLWSDFVLVNITVSYTPPAKAIVTTTTDIVRGSITLAIDNPVPSGTEPVVSHNSIFRRKLGETEFIRIATNVLPDESFTDYTPASEQVYEYYIRAWGDNGTYSDSVIISASSTVNDTLLSLVSDHSQYAILNVSGRSISRNYNQSLMQFAGRKDPVTEFSEHDGLGVGLDYKIYNREELETLLAMCDQKQTMLYRDSRGRREFVTVGDLSITDELPSYYSVSIPMTKTSYEEAV